MNTWRDCSGIAGPNLLGWCPCVLLSCVDATSGDLSRRLMPACWLSSMQAGNSMPACNRRGCCPLPATLDASVAVPGCCSESAVGLRGPGRQHGLRSCSVDVALLQLLWLKPHFRCGCWQCTAVRSNVPGVRSMCRGPCSVDCSVPAGWLALLSAPGSLSLPPVPSWPLPLSCAHPFTSVSGCWLENLRPFVVCCTQQRWCGPPPDHKERILSTHCVREPRACCIKPTAVRTPEQERLQHLHGCNACL